MRINHIVLRLISRCSPKPQVVIGRAFLRCLNLEFVMLGLSMYDLLNDSTDWFAIVLGRIKGAPLLKTLSMAPVPSLLPSVIVHGREKKSKRQNGGAGRDLG